MGTYPRIAITGADGQVGTALAGALSEAEILPLIEGPFDLTDPSAGAAIVDLRPDLVIHAAAWTDVDGCARDPDRAMAVNAEGTLRVAQACEACGAAMVYLSSNEVFDGEGDRPWREDDPVWPVNPYGESKWLGEQYASEVLDRLFIVRTAWVFSPGGRNFPFKILEAAKERDELRVTSDEVASPTYAPDLAAAIGQMIKTAEFGIYHFTNSGVCSRYDFAREILKQAGREEVRVIPISLAEFERPSKVPPFAPLANERGARQGITLRRWEEALGEYLEGEAC